MATASFFARITSSTANAETLVVGSDPSIAITFTNDDPNVPGQDDTGDLILEATGGLPDPDTWVIINGVTYSFTYDVVGNFPTAGQQNANKVPPALQGKFVAVIETPVGNYFFVLDGTATQAQMDLVGNGNLRMQNANLNPPPTPVCFCTGTEILTPSGYRRVETLRAGDHVTNDRGEQKQVIWVGSTPVSLADLRANPSLRPIRIAADAIAPGCPAVPLEVSPQHRIVIEGALPAMLFGNRRILAAAKHLVGTLAEEVMPDEDVDYFHVLLEDHDILIANGLATESFQPARRMIELMSGAERQRLVETLEIVGMSEMLSRKDSLRSLKREEAEVLADALLNGTGRNASPVEAEAANVEQ